MTSIQDFYGGKTVFITGATGFMGKVLVEKLLRSCADVKKIYLLVRAKKGQQPRERVTAILDSKLFELVEKAQPNFREKVHPICGDIMEANLGMSQSDIELLSAEVSVVFHSAATVRFDEVLKLSLQMNVIGTKEMIGLCKKMTKLEALVHVSTAYANCDRTHVTEAVYPLSTKPVKILEAAEWLDEDIIDILTPSLVAPRPNTYTYTKALAEHYITENKGSLPCAIVRPSIVGASFAEPFPGWVDNFNGPTGLLAAIGKGLLRCMKGQFNAKADIIPVDMATNLMIAAAWNTAVERPEKMLIYNSTTGQINHMTWGMMEQASCKYFQKHPLEDIIRIPNPMFTSSNLVRNVSLWVDHYLPAWIFDLFLRMSGKKPIVMRLQNKLQKSIASLDYFTSNEWIFSNENVTMLFDKLSPQEKETFNFDVSQIEWEQYLENYCIGTKQYALKEDMLRLPKAKKSLERLRRRGQIISFLIILIVWRLSLNRFNLLNTLWYYTISMAVRIVKKIPNFAKT